MKRGYLSAWELYTQIAPQLNEPLYMLPQVGSETRVRTVV
jgi:hypothetical protein